MGSCLSQPTQTSQAITTPSGTSGGTSKSPFYKILPKGSEKLAVRNVYDGDTLTLTKDEQRVRLVGIDTPEMKPPQPFAEEAKQYTKSRCHKKDIWILSTGKDHYGRLLAHIFVEEGSNYLCINEGLVQQGLAYAYIPDRNDKPFNWEKLLDFQQDARNAKRGVWQHFKDIDVFKTTNGAAYHQRSCQHLQNIRNLQGLKVSAAADLGLHPCRTCMAEAY
mmetsp:Transcript_28715/g.47819  ORF Transcript_28715/g.47819 Transcript_28715/m.47819 type:complete len:220 (-) Transcript_28715:205-864(-)